MVGQAVDGRERRVRLTGSLAGAPAKRYDRWAMTRRVGAMERWRGGIRVFAKMRLRLAAIVAGALLLPAAVMAQTAPTGQPAPPAAVPTAPAPAAAPSREALQQQLDAQNAKNEALRQRIAKLEEMLKTDVCNNPEAEALLKAEQQAAPR